MGKKKSLRWERGLETVLELVDADMEQWHCHSVWKTMPGTLSTNSWRMVRERPSGRP